MKNTDLVFALCIVKYNHRHCIVAYSIDVYLQYIYLMERNATLLQDEQRKSYYHHYLMYARYNSQSKNHQEKDFSTMIRTLCSMSYVY